MCTKLVITEEDRQTANDFLELCMGICNFYIGDGCCRCPFKDCFISMEDLQDVVDEINKMDKGEN